MKKLAILFIATMLVQNLNAQEVVYVDEDGHIVEIENIEKKRVDLKFKEAMPMQRNTNQIVVRTIWGLPVSSSSDIEMGKNYYLFEVTQAEDTSLIGKPVVCQIIERRKSNLSGSEGRLRLRPLYIEKGTQQIPLVPNDIYRRGLNRTNVKTWTLIPWFIAGSKAQIKPEEYIVLTLDL